MKTKLLGGSIVVVLLAATAFAAPATIILRDGLTGTANVIETTADSVSLEFTYKGTGKPVSLTLPAKRLDPHCFYDIRLRTMEDTAENHLRLAIFCAESSLFARAKIQYERAVAIDPKFVAEVRKMPEVMNGIAARLLVVAQVALKTGDLASAERQAVIITTRFANTDSAKDAQALLEEVEAAAEAKAQAAKKAGLEALSESERMAAKEREKALAPAVKFRDRARKLKARGLRVENQSEAKGFFDAAAGDFERALKAIEGLRADAVDDPSMNGALDDLDGAIREEAISCCVYAGNVALGRRAYPEAQKYANRALEVDPESAQAILFLARVETAMSAEMDLEDVRSRRGPGRRR